MGFRVAFGRRIKSRCSLGPLGQIWPPAKKRLLNTHHFFLAELYFCREARGDCTPSAEPEGHTGPLRSSKQ